jgi:6,7-dimethyl-8-ribityllumazine synthase
MSNAILTIEGPLLATGMKTIIVAARFNSFIVEKLIEGAIDAIVRHGGDAKDQQLVWVPGAWEIPLVAKRAIDTKKPHAVIALGCVIRGGTDHYTHVAAEVSKGVAQVSWETGVPVSRGVLTVDSLDQAIERAGSKMGNKGAEAALAAIETVHVLRALGT